MSRDDIRRKEVSPDEVWNINVPLTPERIAHVREQVSAYNRALQAMHDLLIRAFCSGADCLYLCGQSGDLHAVGLDECHPAP